MLKCRDHETYRALKRPTIHCPDCWLMWVKAHPERAASILSQVEFEKGGKTQIFSLTNHGGL